MQTPACRIVESCLYDNTLVTLPTGLGKTFIAAVVMYNYFRWFPLSKIVFMAPTKPLVQQQIEACFNIMGIPQIEASKQSQAEPKVLWTLYKLPALDPPNFCAELHYTLALHFSRFFQTMVMTGEVAIKTRRDAYKQKRVFFVTPQVSYDRHHFGRCSSYWSSNIPA